MFSQNPDPFEAKGAGDDNCHQQTRLAKHRHKEMCSSRKIKICSTNGAVRFSLQSCNAAINIV